ncbi:hypothetical protein PSHT_07682 [Puccinia striiformis]|uniref:Uncharacterized protein n=1 Tax=Puccinia striiformis TaxID=27350 RepID=A0A2S4VVB9_9BASI|nr:hypothetical protein PSHT_07682 [Puccinia striiformis]
MVLSVQEQVTNGSTVLNPMCSQQQQQSSEEAEEAAAKEALSKASVECGPSLVQRIENGSQSMTDFIIKLLKKSLFSSSSLMRELNRSSAINSNSSISILVGSIGPTTTIRTGALLSLKGFQVFLILNTTITQNGKPTEGILEISTESKTCGNIQELSTSPNLIIKALAKNSVTTSSTFPDKSWINYTLSAPTISIDIPSYLNYNTGEPLVSTNLIPSPQYLSFTYRCLQTKKLDKIPKEICLIDLTLQLLNNDTGPITTSPLNPTLSKSTLPKPTPSSSKPTTSIPPASWDDEWYTILKIG